MAQAPLPTVTVALPMATIHKQLPGGSVKMSLASLYRQAPPGTFTKVRVEDRRMVEVPLSEIFRHVDPQVLRRRHDQRRLDLPKGAPALFGDKANPFVVAPMAEYEDDTPAVALTAPVFSPSPEPVPEPGALRFAPLPAVEPVSNGAADSGPFLLPLASLCGAWAEPFKSEAEAMDGARVDLTHAGLADSLAKGKVTFAWGQIRAWLQPAPSMDTAGPEMTELVLPLKVLAPAWFAHSRPGIRRRTVEVDDSIPALFGGGRAFTPAEKCAGAAGRFGAIG